MRAFLLVFALAALLLAQSPFWKQWGDGQAELSSYDLVVPRDGEPRRGVAITIFVTGTFSKIPVMKLNLMRDVQTGMSNYHDQLTSFIALEPANGRPAGTVAKVSYSRQDWGGNSFQMALFEQSKVRVTRHNSDGDQTSELPHLPNSLADDATFPWARGYAEPRIKPGEQRSVQYLTSSEPGQGSLEWRQALIKRSPVVMRINVDGQPVEAEKVTVQTIDGIKKEFTVELGGQRRILSWEFTTGEKGQLLKSARLKYWEMNKKGMETTLRQLGLVPRPPRTT